MGCGAADLWRIWGTAAPERPSRHHRYRSMGRPARERGIDAADARITCNSGRLHLTLGHACAGRRARASGVRAETPASVRAKRSSRHSSPRTIVRRRRQACRSSMADARSQSNPGVWIGGLRRPRPNTSRRLPMRRSCQFRAPPGVLACGRSRRSGRMVTAILGRVGCLSGTRAHGPDFEGPAGDTR